MLYKFPATDFKIPHLHTTTCAKFVFIVECGPPPLEPNATSTHDHTVVGGTTVYICQPGYRFDGGSESVNSTCKINRKWSKPAEGCTGASLRYAANMFIICYTALQMAGPIVRQLGPFAPI